MTASAFRSNVPHQALLLCAVLATFVAGAATEDPRLLQGRDIAARFQQELSAKLSAAMTSGGPVEAIEICNADAPGIAARLSAETGAKVRRTALKLRNPANAPDSAERAALEDFDRRVRSGAAQPIESFVTAGDGSARYLRAILTQPPCLACHGPHLSAEVKDAVARHYPADRATGFNAGELRGAFVVEWPGATQEPQP